jgi:hypothetical protein
VTHAEGVRPFPLAGAVYLERVAGQFAGDLEELREGLARAPAEVLFLHTQLPRLAAADATGAASDDFSHWVGAVVQDAETAERLSFALQHAGTGAEPLRAALLETLERRPEAERRRRQAPPGGEFVFRAADPVLLPTGAAPASGRELRDQLARADLTVWFHHLVAEPWLWPAEASLFAWLEEAGETELLTALREEAESGRGIRGVRDRLLRRWRRRDLGQRIVDAADQSAASRREAGRATAARLVRRLIPPKSPA